MEAKRTHIKLNSQTPCPPRGAACRAVAILRRLIPVILCVPLAGCLTTRTGQPLGGGYEEVTYTRTSLSEESANQISLQYTDGNGKRIMVWPSVWSHVIRGDTLLFIGVIGNRSTRFFAAREPGPLLDITDEVLWRWAKESGKDFSQALKITSAQSLKQQEDRVTFDFAFWAQDDWPHVVAFDWTQISDIMREVKEKGVIKKDQVWGTSYIQKDFKQK